MYSSYKDARADQYKFKVIYFDGRGRGEAVRMILAAGGKEFDDQRIPLGAEEWTKLKPSKRHFFSRSFLCVIFCSDCL